MPKLHLLAALLCTVPFGLFSQSSALTGADNATDLPQRTCASHEKFVEMMGFQKYAGAQQRIEDHTTLWNGMTEA